MSIDPAVFLFFAAIIVGALVILILRGKHWQWVAGGMVFFVVLSVVFGGLAWAGVPGVWNINNPNPPPTSQAIFTVRILGTSATAVAAVTGVISSDGLTDTWAISDAALAGLTYVELQVSVTNANLPSNETKTWPFDAHFVSCSTILSGNVQETLCLNNPDGTQTVTMSLLQLGAPTGSQAGNTFTSNDWATGASDILDIRISTDTAVATAMVQGQSVTITYNVGGTDVHAVINNKG